MNAVILQEYRETANERGPALQTFSRIVSKGRTSVLDVGARDSHFSLLLAKYFETVTALELEKPRIEHPFVITVAGDVTNPQFNDNAFDCVFCTEVLEHVPNIEKACKEIIRGGKTRNHSWSAF